MFCISGPNLVILAWMSDELSCGQARDWYTHTRTYRPTDAADDYTRRPKLASGQKPPLGAFMKVKKESVMLNSKSYPGSLLYQRSFCAEWVLRSGIDYHGLYPFYLFWTNDDVWDQKCWSTLVQVMVCCLSVPGHHLYQGWFFHQICSLGSIKSP